MPRAGLAQQILVRMGGSGVEHADSRFVRALALADTRGFGEQDWEILRATGVSHLMAISGLHIGLMAGLAALLMRLLYRAWPGLGLRLPLPQGAAAAALLAAAGYAALAGFGLPTVRSLLMIAVVLLAVLLRRVSGPWQAYALALIVMLLSDPLALLGAGFWLSFVGVAWLLWCLPSDSARMPGWRRLLGRTARRQSRPAAFDRVVLWPGLAGRRRCQSDRRALGRPAGGAAGAARRWAAAVRGRSAGRARCCLPAGRWSCCGTGWNGAPRIAACPDVPAGSRRHWRCCSLAAAALWLLLPRGTPGKPLARATAAAAAAAACCRAPRQGEAELVLLDVGQGLSVLVRTRQPCLAVRHRARLRRRARHGRGRGGACAAGAGCREARSTADFPRRQRSCRRCCQRAAGLSRAAAQL